MNCENCANAYDEGYTAGHNAENARLRKYAQSGAATFEDLYVRDQEIARLREQVAILQDGRCTSCMEPINPLNMKCQCVRNEFETLYFQLTECENEVSSIREQAEALADALRNQGLLQNTFHGKIWHVHDCSASFDFAECHYRCRVAREAFALAGMEPYVSPETRRDTEVYE